MLHWWRTRRRMLAKLSGVVMLLLLVRRGRPETVLAGRSDRPPGRVRLPPGAGRGIFPRPRRPSRPVRLGSGNVDHQHARHSPARPRPGRGRAVGPAPPPMAVLHQLGYATGEVDDPYAAVLELCRRPQAYQSVILGLTSLVPRGAGGHHDGQAAVPHGRGVADPDRRPPGRHGRGHAAGGRRAAGRGRAAPAGDDDPPADGHRPAGRGPGVGRRPPTTTPTRPTSRS